jgi:hypothetical protein
MNNLTEKELNSMTLGQLHQMAQQAWQNATPGQCRMLNQNGSDCRGPRCLMPGSGPDAGSKNAAFGCGGNGRMGRASLLLLTDDLTMEELNNMTLGQIRDLEQKKMQERNNMTLGQIRELEQKKMEEQNNMTLSELREEAKQQHQIASLLNFASIPGVNPVCEAMGGRQGCRGGAL